MPLGIRGWPVRPDPRLPSFNMIGFDGRATPPYRWGVFASGGSQVWQKLAFGVYPELISEAPGYALWQITWLDPEFHQLSLFSLGYDQLTSPIDPYTHQFEIGLASVTEGNGTCGRFDTLPYAIQPFEMDIYDFDAKLDLNIQQPMRIEPVPWDFIPP